MLFSNETYGKPFAKDPAAVKYKGKYFLYHTVLRALKRIGIGIAVSRDGENYDVAGELPPLLECEKNGIGAPGVIVLEGALHMFYQTYGNYRRDAICHAVSYDGFNFERLGEVFSPSGEWNCGRAIDADVCVFGDRLMLYCATRDREYRVQMLAVASAPLGSPYAAGDFRQICDSPVLSPRLGWEQDCIEAPATIVREGKIYMFYGGAYNCKPQQIGCAVSEDGVHFTRMSDEPFLKNGDEGEWNASESGHPYVCEADGKSYLYYQGSPDNGASWYISKREFVIKDGMPVLL